MARYMNKGERGENQHLGGKRLGGALPFTGQNSFGGGEGPFFWALSRAATVAAQKAGGLGGRAGRSGGKGKAALRLHIGANINREKAPKRKEGRCPFMCAW